MSRKVGLEAESLQPVEAFENDSGLSDMTILSLSEKVLVFVDLAMI